MKVRRITKGEVVFLSLCQAGKNYMPTLYKALGEPTELALALLKGSTSQVERGELHALVYAPNKVDADGEFAGEDVIKELAYSFMQNGGQIDLHHDERPLGKDQAFVAETFLVQKGDKRFEGALDVQGKPVNAAGAWAVVVKLLDPALKELYKSGAWSGVSMGGRAAREDAEDPEKTNKAQSGQQENDMALTEQDKKEIAEIAAASAAAAVTKAMTSTPPARPASLTSLKDVKAFRKRLEQEQLQKAAEEEVDWSDPESVAAYEEALEKAESEAKASRKPLLNKAADGDQETGDEEQDMLKAGQERGHRMADWVNRNRGYVTQATK